MRLLYLRYDWLGRTFLVHIPYTHQTKCQTRNQEESKIFQLDLSKVDDSRIYAQLKEKNMKRYEMMVTKSLQGKTFNGPVSRMKVVAHWHMK